MVVERSCLEPGVVPDMERDPVCGVLNEILADLSLPREQEETVRMNKVCITPRCVCVCATRGQCGGEAWCHEAAVIGRRHTTPG